MTPGRAIVVTEAVRFSPAATVISLLVDGALVMLAVQYAY
jgi:hypothetical protein